MDCIKLYKLDEFASPRNQSIIYENIILIKHWFAVDKAGCTITKFFTLNVADNLYKYYMCIICLVSVIENVQVFALDPT